MPGFNIGGSGNSQGDPIGKAEAKRDYRWLFYLGDAADGDLRKSCLYLKSCSRPGWGTAAIKQHHNQEEIHHIGKTVWDPFDIVWYDMEHPVNCSGIIWDWMERTTNHIPNANPQHPGVYKKDATLNLLNHEGEVVEEWAIYNAWASKVASQALSYESGNLCAWTCTITYDRAVRKIGAAANVGAAT